MKIKIPVFWVLTCLFLWVLAMSEDLTESDDDVLTQDLSKQNSVILSAHMASELNEFFGYKNDLINT